MAFSIIQGDLFDPAHNFDGLAQGVNTQGVMGGGIAVPFKETYPDMYEEYKAECDKNGIFLGGHVQWSVGTDSENRQKVIYNMFTQFYPGKDGAYISLVARAAYSLRQLAELHSKVFAFSQTGENSYEIREDWRVGMPWVGCGIGGLKRHNVEHVLRKYLEDSPVEFVLVEQEKEA